MIWATLHHSLTAFQIHVQYSKKINLDLVQSIFHFLVMSLLVYMYVLLYYTMLQVRRGNRDNLGIISHNSPFKHIL